MVRGGGNRVAWRGVEQLRASCTRGWPAARLVRISMSLRQLASDEVVEALPELRMIGFGGWQWSSEEERNGSWPNLTLRRGWIKKEESLVKTNERRHEKCNWKMKTTKIFLLLFCYWIEWCRQRLEWKKESDLIWPKVTWLCRAAVFFLYKNNIYILQIYYFIIYIYYIIFYTYLVIQ